MQVMELGHIVLYVGDVERSRRFYADVLGWREVGPARGGAAFFSSGRTHHELLLIEVGKDATPIPSGRRVGMYHFGLKVGETDDDLRGALQSCIQAGVQVVGASDHGVSHSLYVLDPDGNEVELYIDVQPEVWRERPEALLVPTRPLHL
jgi:catechol-2,3-dioxygenase